MRLAQHPTMLRLLRVMSAWSVKKPDVLHPGILGIQGSMVLRLRPCMPLPFPLSLPRLEILLPAVQAESPNAVPVYCMTAYNQLDPPFSPPPPLPPPAWKPLYQQAEVFRGGNSHVDAVAAAVVVVVVMAVACAGLELERPMCLLLAVPLLVEAGGGKGRGRGWTVRWGSDLLRLPSSEPF